MVLSHGHNFEFHYLKTQPIASLVYCTLSLHCSLYDTLKPSSSQTDVRVSSKEPPPSGEDTPPDSGDYIVMNNAEPPLVTKVIVTIILSGNTYRYIIYYIIP